MSRLWAIISSLTINLLGILTILIAFPETPTFVYLIWSFACGFFFSNLVEK